MLSDRNGGRDTGKAYGLFAAAFAVLLVVLAVLAQFGLAEPVIGVLVTVVVLATYAAIGWVTRTMRLTDFFVAGRSVPEALNGMATAAAFLSSSAILGLAGAFFAQGDSALAIVLGWSFGFLVLAVLIAPYFRKSGALTLPDFLAIRFGSRLIRLAGLVVLLVSSVLALAAALASFAAIAGLAFDISPRIAILAAVAVILSSTLFGGMRGVTLVAGVQAIVILFAVLAPVAILSARDYGFPVAQLTYGYALDEIAADPSGALPALVGLPSRLLPFGRVDTLDFVFVAFCLAAGVASLPHLVMRSATVSGPRAARRSVGWALVVVLAILLTAPAYAAFARLALLQNVVDIPLEELGSWVFAFGRAGLVQICGVDAASLDAVREACTKIGAMLTPADVTVATDAIALALPGIAELPYVLGALMVAGALTAALAAASALLVAIATSISHDLYASILAPRAPMGRKLFVARLAIVATAAFAGWLAFTRSGDIFRLAAVSLAIAASGNFPALVLAIWWKRATPGGVLAGQIAGFGVAVLLVLLTRYGGGVLGLPASGVPAVAAATLGVPVGFFVAIAVSLVTPSPKLREQVLDAIRRPTREELFEEAPS